MPIITIRWAGNLDKEQPYGPRFIENIRYNYFQLLAGVKRLLGFTLPIY